MQPLTQLLSTRAGRFTVAALIVAALTICSALSAGVQTAIDGLPYQKHVVPAPTDTPTPSPATVAAFTPTP